MQNELNLLVFEDKSFSEIWIMEKDKSYPCKSKKYKSKDGIHIVFPNIIIKKSTYRKIVELLKADHIMI